MKNQILLIVAFCLLAFSCFGKLTEKEKENWEKLDWIVRGTVPGSLGRNPSAISLRLWKDDVYIALEGDCNQQDSLELKKIIAAFDEAIPFRNFYWAMDKEPTLTIFFTEFDKGKFYPKSHLIDYTFYSSTNPKYSSLIASHKFELDNIREATLYLRKEADRAERNIIMWHGFAKILAGNEKGGGFRIGKLSVLGGELARLTDFDKFFFRTIYAPALFSKYNEYLSSDYSMVQIIKYVAPKDSKAKMILLIQIIVFGLFAYLIYHLCWENWLKRIVKNKLQSYLIIGYLLVIPAVISNISYHYLKYEFLFPDVTPPSGNSSSYMSIFPILLFYGLMSASLYVFEQVLFGKVQKFYQKQIVRSASILLLYISFTGMNSIFGNPSDYILLFQKIQFVDLFIYTLLIIGIRLIIFHNQNQKKQIRKHQQIKIDAEKQLQTQFQLEAIQARTNPHFLYNALNTIASLAKQDADKTEDFALKLSRLLRLRLNENQAVEISLKEEIETTKLYLEIEKERFYDRLDYSINYPKESGETQIPSNILFCLTENAVKHGINNGGNKISIDIEETKQMITLCVSDNGNDFPENPVFGTGLKSLMEKLEILYPGNHELAIQNKPEKKIMVTLNKNGAE